MTKKLFVVNFSWYTHDRFADTPIQRKMKARFKDNSVGHLDVLRLLELMIVISVLCSCIQSVSSAASSDARQRCVCSNTVVNCTGVNLQVPSVASLTPELTNVTVLLLRNSGLTSTGWLAALQQHILLHLQVLSLADNSIASFDRNTFANMPTLITLDIRKNPVLAVSLLPVDIFLGLSHSLTTMKISLDNVDMAHALSFINATKCLRSSLTQLYIQGGQVQLGLLVAASFAQLSLLELHLMDDVNNKMVLPSSAGNWSSIVYSTLQSLTVRYSKITSLQNLHLETMPNLRQLNLACTFVNSFPGLITYLGSMATLGNLDTLVLDYVTEEVTTLSTAIHTTIDVNGN